MLLERVTYTNISTLYCFDKFRSNLGYTGDTEKHYCFLEIDWKRKGNVYWMQEGDD